MAATSGSFSGHIVGIATPAWGHWKPLAALASKIVQERSDILVTLLAVGDYASRAEEEISRYFPEHSAKQNPRYNIRVINMGGEGRDHVLLFPAVVENFGPIYTKLARLEPVLCSTGKSYNTPLKPTLAIVDFLFPQAVQIIRNVSENDLHVAVLAWSTQNASGNFRLLGPEKYGGYGDVKTRARDVAIATGKDVAEVEKDLYHNFTGAILRMPGTPPVFDYELAPQEISIDIPRRRRLIENAYQFMTLCDGIISATSAVFEPEAHEAWRKWLGERNQSYYVLGPLQSQGSQSGNLAANTKQNDLSSFPNGQDLLEFLDNTLQTNGSNSLLYISWGSIIWPRGDHLWKLIDVLLELNFPFILAHASPLAKIPAEVSAKVKASGIGMLSPWAPQQLIFAHPATGWSLTHCGQNSVTEATSQGIPMIAWPFDVDEANVAAQLSVGLDMAFELIEVRTGHGLKPLYRGVTPKGTIDAVESEFREVLTNAKGPVGDRKRRNIQVLKDAMMGAWDDEGDAAKSLRKLLNDHFPRTEH